MKVCAYAMDKYAKQTYAQESHDVRAWPGFEVVLDSCRRAGWVIEYAGKATACDYDVVLVSITSDCDWWPFIAERLTWRKSAFVICGGAGVLNVRPFLQWIGAFVLGRGEDILPAMLESMKRGEKLDSVSVIYSEDFSTEKKYEICQAKQPYPHQVLMTNGKVFKESSIGCPGKCFFCGYTWQRKYIGDGSYSAGVESMNSGNRERTIVDLLNLPPVKWQDQGPVRIVGVDGTSERLRMQVNKRITREMLRSFFRGLAEIPKPHQVKLYFICGYPNETEDDWSEFLDDLRAVDGEMKQGKQWSLLCHFTPFRAMPATPSATWPMSYKNYRGVISQNLKKPNMKGNIFFQGNRFWAVEGMGTDSLPTVSQSAIILRGKESDACNIAKVAQSKKYWGASTAVKQATIEKYFDIKALFAAHDASALATGYLKTYCNIKHSLPKA